MCIRDRYGVEYEGVDQPAPSDAGELARQAETNLGIVAAVLRDRRDVVESVSDRLLELAGRVPERVPSFNLGGVGKGLFEDRRLYDFRAYPPQIWKQPGEKAPNRAALGAWGAWVNSFAKAEYCLLYTSDAADDLT